jgi:hypothetical protein
VVAVVAGVLDEPDHHRGSGPDSTLQVVVGVFLVAAVVIIPSLGLLSTLDQNDLVDVDAGSPRCPARFTRCG